MASKGYLPAETTSFVGRSRELAQLGTLLARDRLVTLTGVGGVGKSRLALRAAARAAPSFADGARLVALTPLRDPALLGHVVLEELRLTDPSALPPVDVIATWLADKELLLVLDSCEHLVEGCGRLARALLDAAPGLRILATSRQPLAVPGERSFEVHPLPLPRPGTDSDAPEHPGDGDAVELFAQRAASAVDGFVIAAPADRAAAAAVCRRLDGIPLAVELAAAQLAELPERSVYRLNDRLQHRFETLIAQSGTGGRELPRHRTLRTTIGWSHELCTPLERLLWARLSVVIGGFDLAGAQAVGSGGPLPAREVAGVLAGLVAKSLVREQPEGPHEKRFGMLDTVREYGAHWLYELGEETAARRRHRAFYRDLACHAEAAWIGPDQVFWHRRLVAEHANFRTAMDFCLAEGDGRGALEIGGALWMMWFAFGYAREGAHYLDLALDMWATPGPERAKALWARGLACLCLGDLRALGRCVEQLREATEGSADPTAPTAIGYLTCAGLTLSGRQERSLAVLDAMVRPPESRGAFPAAWYLARVTRGFVHVHRGDFAAADAVAADLAEQCGQRGDRWLRSYGLYVRALAAAGAGRFAEAGVHARRTIADKALFRDSIGTAIAVDTLAASAAGGGQTARGARLLGIGQRIWQTLGRPQMGMPELLAARAGTERLIRAGIGDIAYETEFAAGLATPPAEGIAYCLTETGPANRM